MTWFRVDDSFPQHPKVLRIPRRDRLAIVGLWATAGAWCGWNLTDGALEAHMVEEFGGSDRQATELVRVGLWERTEGGYLFHDWADWNKTKAEVEAERAAARQRMNRRRSGRSPGGTPEGSSPDVRPNTQGDSEGTSAAVREPRPDPSLPTTTERGEVTSVDASEPNTPLEDPTPDEPRRSAAAVAVHADAMPPDRCPVHRELDHVPPCRNCQRAREAQEQWLADRDRKVTEARAAVAAEQREARRLERQQIDDCARCDTRGVMPNGVACTHDERSDPDAVSAGRAAFQAERAKLAARAAARAKTDTPPPATGEQLRLIAMRFAAHGVTDRDKRITTVSDVIGRRIGSTRELTRAEASLVLDRFDHPPAEEPPEVLPGDPDFDAGDQDDDLPPQPDQDDATGGFEDEYRTDQQTWADDNAEPLVYAGNPTDPPF